MSGSAAAVVSIAAALRRLIARTHTTHTHSTERQSKSRVRLLYIFYSPAQMYIIQVIERTSPANFSVCIMY